MSSPKTVVLLTAVAGWRGSATSYLKIARGMIGSGWRVHLIAGGEALLGPFEASGATVEVAVVPHTGIGSARDLAARLRRVGASVVIADTPRDMRVAVLAGLLTGVPVVYRYNLNYRQPNTGLIERLYLGAASGFIFQSRAIRDAFLAAYPSRRSAPMWLIPNGYDADDLEHAFVEALRFRFAVPTGRPLVVCGAMLVASKGHDALLRAAMIARDQGVDFTLMFCGAGGAADAIADDARQLGIKVLFTGFLAANEMRAAYQMADLVVHPSEREIFPNVVAEAMHAGAAVVAVDSWGTREVVGEEGVLVPPRDPPTMAAAIVELLHAPERRHALGSSGQRRIKHHFPLARMVDGYRRVIEAVVKSDR